ncbi:class I SAM-dependent methyltransferase [Streptomyces sp. Ncost-T10-10d]|uniref:class I SAM-dependent methyltransferase n=1 Tax=Streptomyces sp. Ncost-T10-10d TaxID=1839774 RepID=UPI00159EFB80|nr:class I SAM-dependent methyltransferase [Streptomyces sp. Ncost-T10-10d]
MESVEPVEFLAFVRSLDSLRDWRADPYTDAPRSGRGPLFLRCGDGWLLPLEIERWCATAASADNTAPARCRGPVLDIGCGPGRLVTALAALGRPALGIDVSQEAVDRTVRGGGAALCRSVFDPLPSEGRWGTVLLVDGNTGIGGDAAALPARTAELVGPDGVAIVEAAALDVDERVDVRVVDGRGTRGTAFPWARVGIRALSAYSESTGWTAAGPWQAEDRWFLELRRRRTSLRTMCFVLRPTSIRGGQGCGRGWTTGRLHRCRTTSRTSSWCSGVPSRTSTSSRACAPARP